MDQEVEVLDPQGMERGHREAPETRPAVVEVLRAFGEAEAREVEGDAPAGREPPARAPCGREKAGARHTVDADHGLARPLLPDEAHHPRRLEGTSSPTVALDDLLAGHRFDPNQASALSWEGAGTLGSWIATTRA